MNLECKVKNEIPLGGNVLFLAEVVCLHVDEKTLDEKGGVDLKSEAYNVQSDQCLFGNWEKAR